MSRVCRNGVLAEGDATPGSFPAGAGFFETVALRTGAVECLDDHLARLRAGMSRAGFAPGSLAAGDMAAWRAALGLLGGQDGVLRLVVGSDFEELGLRALLPSPEVFRLRSLRTARDAERTQLDGGGHGVSPRSGFRTREPFGGVACGAERTQAKDFGRRQQSTQAELLEIGTHDETQHAFLSAKQTERRAPGR